MPHVQVIDLENDLRDGIIMINLIEHLTGKPVTKKYQKAPSHRLQRLDNMGLVFEILSEEGIKLVSTSEFKSMNQTTLHRIQWTCSIKYIVCVHQT